MLRWSCLWSLLCAMVVVLLLAACSGAAPTPEATAPADARVEHGRALFRNKGCVTCHVNKRVAGKTGVYVIGPDLTDYTNSPEFLRQWLANPRAVRPGTEMSDLDLSTAEIEDLIAFLNEPR